MNSDLTYLDGELSKNLAKHGATNGAGAFLVGATLTAADLMMGFSAECVPLPPGAPTIADHFFKTIW